MSTNIDLKELWNKQETVIPDTKELFEKMQTFKKKHLHQLVLMNVLLILTSAFIIFVWYFFQPEMISTKLGIVLVILAMALFLFVSNKTMPLLAKVDYDLDSKESLKQLLKFKVKQQFLQGTMLNIYFILLSTGICMYMFEYTSRMTLIGGSLAYEITLLWITFNWFYLRPKQIKKQQTKTDDLINKFKLLSDQLAEKK